MSAPATAAGPRVDPSRSGSTVVVAAVVLALLPLVVSAVVVGLGIGRQWHPWSDWALTELQVRDVGRHPVDIGLYSRDGWSHPGPLLFYLLAVPYRLLGREPAGLLVGALMINGASVLAMAWVARRRGGVPLLLCTLVATALLLRALGADLWQDPWVCYVTTLPFGALLLLAWAAACGDRWALPAAAVVGTFLSQADIGFVAVGIPILLVAAMSWAWRLRSAGTAGSTSRPRLTPVAVTLGLLALLWLPTVLHELGSDDGNLERTVRWFRDTDEEAHSLVEGYRVVAGQFGLPPEWVAGIRPGNPFSGATPLVATSPPPVLLVPAIGAAVVLLRRRQWDELRLFGVAGVAIAVSTVAVARTVGIMYQYRLLWTLLLPTVAVGGAAWAGWCELERRWPAAGRRVLVPAAVVALAALGLANSWSAVGAAQPRAEESGVSRPLVSQVMAALPEADGDVVVRYPDHLSWWYASTVLNELERRGLPAKVDEDPARIYGEGRVHGEGDPVRAVLTVAVDDRYDELATTPPGRLVAYVSDRPPAERAGDIVATRPQRAAIDAAVEAGELSPSDVEDARRRAGVPGSVAAVFMQEQVPAG